MDAHRVEVLDRADHDAVVRAVAHDLELEFLPACDRSLHEDLAHRAGGETSGREPAEGLVVGGNARTGAPEDEGRPDDEREADDDRRLERFLHVMGKTGLGHRKPDLGHRLLEPVAVLGGADRLELGADELHSEPVQNPVLGELDREVERHLSAHRRQQGVGPLPLDDRGEHIHFERLDVSPIGEVGVGHDRGRVRVRQDDAVPLLPQHPAGLGARVVELASLADDDRAGADDEDRRDVVAPAHQLAAMSARNSSNRYLASCGPGPASGWYWTLNARASVQRRPSMTPSFRLTWLTAAPVSVPSATA